VTRGGPTMEFVERSGVDNLASIRPCAYCGKPAAYRDHTGQPAHTTCAGESSEEKLLAKINTLESRAMTTNMTIDERYYRAGQLEQFISDQRAEFEDRDLPPDDVHQSLKNAEEELARHTAVIDQRKAWDRQMIEGVRSGRYQVESGDGRTVDLGRNSDHSHDHVPQWLLVNVMRRCAPLIVTRVPITWTLPLLVGSMRWYARAGPRSIRLVSVPATSLLWGFRRTTRLSERSWPIRSTGISGSDPRKSTPGAWSLRYSRSGH
jgi:hypothetical protein